MSLPSRSKLTPIFDAFDLTLVYLFGSVARGDTHTHSDIDIAYLARAPLTLQERSDLAQALKPLFHPSRDIDLVALGNASPLLTRLILSEGTKLHGSAQEEDRFYRTTMKRYIDAKPLFEATQQYVKEHLPV